MAFRYSYRFDGLLIGPDRQADAMLHINASETQIWITDKDGHIVTPFFDFISARLTHLPINREWLLALPQDQSFLTRDMTLQRFFDVDDVPLPRPQNFFTWFSRAIYVGIIGIRSLLRVS